MYVNLYNMILISYCTRGYSTVGYSTVPPTHSAATAV